MKISGHFLFSMVRHPLRLASVTCAVFCGVSLQASFRESVEVAGERLTLRGESSFRWFLFDLYDAALYLPEGASAENALGNIPKKLIIRYKREIPSEKIIAAGNTLLQKNCLPEEFAAIQNGLEAINRAYTTPQKGDTYALSFHPERGSTVLYFNDEEVASVAGEDFANLYFRIWLGEHPVSEKFRNELLRLPG